MLDNTEIEKILEKLENIDDEQLAVELLREFNRYSSELGKLLLNLDKTLSHDEWKKRCDETRAKLDSVINKINQY
jgi:hypothetical protein